MSSELIGQTRSILQLTLLLALLDGKRLTYGGAACLLGVTEHSARRIVRRAVNGKWAEVYYAGSRGIGLITSTAKANRAISALLRRSGMISRTT